MTSAANRPETATADIRIRVMDALNDAGLVQKLTQPNPGLTDNALAVLHRRYQAKDREGNVVEEPDQMFHRVAQNLAQADRRYGADDQEVARTEAEFYRVMVDLDYMPNSPTLMNAGRELQMLSACFVLPVEDSMEAIFETVKEATLVQKSGGGTGFAFSRLRPEGDIVGSTGGVASGPVSFMRAFDGATEAVKQGSTRRGANMGILHVTHPDIMKFITSKEDGKSIANFNISVAVTEDFMEKVKNGEEYDLLNPRTGKVQGRLNAKEVFDLLADMAWKTGDPGIVFLDRINRDNPNPQLGEIESTNPCGEQPLLPYESCNLGSINLARMVRFTRGGAEVDKEKLASVISTAVHMLDNVIDMNDYPIREIEDMSHATRRIGLGVMGFSDLLVQLGIPYNSDEALTVAEDVMSFIQRQTNEASAKLAEDPRRVPGLGRQRLQQPRPGTYTQLRPYHDSAHRHDFHHLRLLQRHRTPVRLELRPERHGQHQVGGGQPLLRGRGQERRFLLATAYGGGVRNGQPRSRPG